MAFWHRDPKKKYKSKLDAAVKAGDADEVTRLLDLGASPQGDDLLFKAAFDGGTEKHHDVIKLLLARGADVNEKNSIGCTALTGAAEKGTAPMLQTLLDAGADPHATCHGRDAYSWAVHGGNTATLLVLRPPKPEARPAPQPEVKPAPLAPRKEGPDEVVFLRPFGERTLEETFNFASRERITLLKRDADGAVEAMTRESFSLIDDKDALRYAFSHYRAKGGRLDEADVFPDALGKKSLPGRQP